MKSVDFTPDSTKLVTGSNEKLVKIFDLNKPDSGNNTFLFFSSNILIIIVLDPQIFSGHTAGLKHVLHMEDGKRILSCAEDKTVRCWDILSGKVIFIDNFH